MAGVQFPGQAKTVAEGRTNVARASTKTALDDAKPAPSVSTTTVTPPAKTAAASSTPTGQKTLGPMPQLSDSEMMQPVSNPLSHYSSSTYNISLYMATPEAINSFVETGAFDPKQDFYIVAQSGGINTTEKRAITLDGTLGPDKEGLDYFIDDLQIEIVLTGTDGTPTVGTDIKFKIVEPIGFSFFEKLQIVSGQINSRSAIVSASGSKPAPLQQNYLIGVRFYGYDENGNLAKAKTFQKNQFYNRNLMELQSNVNQYATYERYFSILISRVNYQIDGRMVTYYVEGTPISKQIGHGTKFGIVKSANSIVAGTVAEALQSTGNASGTRGLMQIMNNQQTSEKATKNISHQTVYKIEWGEGTEMLQNSALGQDTSLQANARVPLSGAATTAQSNVATAVAAQSMNTTKKQINIPAGTILIQMMDQIMAKSEYVSKTLIAKNDAGIQTTMEPNAPRSNISWYSINPIVKVLGRDEETADWYYEITYKIDIQTIQYMKSLYRAEVSRWRGPHKRYNFFYTGQNTEVLSFEQKYNNQYYILQAMTTGEAVKREGVTTPHQVQGGSAGVAIGGKINKGSEVEKTAAISLNSIADQAMAEIKIIGDPDYLMSNVGGVNLVSNNIGFQSQYGFDPNTMNPYLGQIWIQILFKGAEDYKSDGTLKLLDVNFYGLINQPDKNLPKKVDGMIYRVIKVTSNFASGKFTQNLELILVGENELNLGQNTISDAGRETSSADAGAGRGSQGGPTAQELADWQKRSNSVKQLTDAERKSRFSAMVAGNDDATASYKADIDRRLIARERERQENRLENSRLLSRATTQSNEYLLATLPGGNRNSPRRG